MVTLIDDAADLKDGASDLKSADSEMKRPDDNDAARSIRNVSTSNAYIRDQVK